MTRLAQALAAALVIAIAVDAGAQVPRDTRTRVPRDSVQGAPRGGRGAPAQEGIDTARVRAQLERLKSSVEKANGRLSVAVVDVDSGVTLAAHAEGDPLNPASNTKLYTAWAALKLLGPGHRYATGLYGRRVGARVERLIVRGDGDPSFEHRHVWELVALLEREGVREIGDVVVDQSFFDEAYTPPSFDQQPNEWASFRAPVAATSVAGNTVAIEVRPTVKGQAATLRAVPDSFVELRGAVSTSPPGTPESVSIVLEPHGGRLRGVVAGSVPEGARTVVVYRRVEDPTLLVGHALRDACDKHGIRVSGRVTAGRRAKEPLIAAHKSEPLVALLNPVGKQSNNFWAEMIFKSLGAVDGKPASFATAAARIKKLLSQEGLDDAQLRIDNGSGLFDANRASAGAIARLLAAASRDRTVGAELVAQLAIGGVDGTLKGRFREHARSRAIRAKTGTLASASALSGYVLGGPGRHALAFSVLVNGARGKSVAVRGDIDRFVSSLAR